MATIALIVAVLCLPAFNILVPAMALMFVSWFVLFLLGTVAVFVLIAIFLLLVAGSFFSDGLRRLRRKMVSGIMRTVKRDKRQTEGSDSEMSSQSRV